MPSSLTHVRIHLTVCFSERMMVDMVADDLTRAEHAVLEAFQTGRGADFTTGNDEADDPTGGIRWDSDRQVRGEVIAELLRGKDPIGGHDGTVRIRAVRITGVIDLEDTELKRSLSLVECHIADGIWLTGTTARTVVLQGCYLGPIRLAKANIDGDFSLRAAYLLSEDQALTAEGLSVTGDMFCDRFHADGEVYLSGARVGGLLSLGGAYLNSAGERPALTADRLTVVGNMFCDQGFRAHGEVHLSGANVSGQLSFRGAQLDGKGSPALYADGVVTAGMFCDEGFSATGEIRLNGASIGGVLSLSGARLTNPDQPALTADRLTVTGGMFCDKGFRATGEIRLNGASIGGVLSLSGASLNSNGDRSVLAAAGLKVAAGMFCDRGFRAVGEVRLNGASIGGALSLSGASLNSNGDRSVLAAAGLKVAAGMFCDEGFSATGEVRLTGASVGGQLSFRGAHLDGKGSPALYADGVVTEGMFCDQGFSATGEVRLNGANVGLLVDDPTSWPQRLELTDLTYTDLQPFLPARERLKWLHRSSHYSPHSYEQLAAYYRRQGLDEMGRLVLLHQQRARWRLLPVWTRWWGWLQDGLAGYGYVPGRALLLLLFAFVAGWMFYRTHYPPPVDASTHPSFNAALYTVDVLIPAPGIGQASDWNPHGMALVVAAGLRLLGWVLTITVISAITRALARK
jgi:hypothetical protein